jgi:CRISPR-associated endonuclease Csn1
MDDSFNNKVLCIAKENQEKGNKLPYEWLNERFEIFKDRVLSMKDTLGYKKINNLLTDKINTEGFIERNLNDTRYISRTCKKYLETYLKIGKDDNTIKVHAINGILTSELRHKWGLKDKDRGNDKHHAEDAVIIALTNSSMVNKLSNYYKELESRKHPVFPKPFKLFDQILNNKLNKLPKNKILVSRPPRKKITGAAHKETVISPKKKNDSMVKIHNGNGYAEQALMPRLDVFKKEGKYYYVPIYVADFAQNELPNRIIMPGKKKSEWDILDDKYEFLFSLYKNDLIEIKQKDKDKIIGYYQKIGISGSQITYQNIDGSKNINRKGENIDPYFGGKTLEYFKKYQVDPLGFYYEIKKELRLPINNKKH